MPRSDKIELTPEQIELIQEMSGLGMTVPQIAAKLGISKSTFERRVKEMVQLAEALEKGRADALYLVTGELFKKCMSGDLGAICFYLKCRARWSESQNITKEDAQKVFELAYNIQKPKEE